MQSVCMWPYSEFIELYPAGGSCCDHIGPVWQIICQKILSSKYCNDDFQIPGVGQTVRGRGSCAEVGELRLLPSKQPGSPPIKFSMSFRLLVIINRKTVDFHLYCPFIEVFRLLVI